MQGKTNIKTKVERNIECYLESSDIINWAHPEVLKQAQLLSEGSSEPAFVAKRCFEFVRDNISHSWDVEQNPVTCKASDVLRYRTGFCYAKSHLLAALLRANRIPAGLCYQRLTITKDQPPYCLHGLNAIFLADYGWYRVDARGNKLGVKAEFSPPIEKLAFPVISSGEADWPEPMPVVVEALQKYSRFNELANNLPDIVLSK